MVLQKEAGVWGCVVGGCCVVGGQTKCTFNVLDVAFQQNAFVCGFFSPVPAKNSIRVLIAFQK